MNKKLKYIFYFLPVFLLLACNDEDFLYKNNSEIEYSDTRVEFSFDTEEDFQTRGVENPKKNFNPGDFIHIEANFYDEDGELIETVYRAFSMDLNGEWKPAGNKSLYWPAHSKTGSFKAFFVNNVKDVLLQGDRERELRLSDVTDQTDPLMDVTGSIAWGHKVNLKFKHICTHLTFTGLDPDISDYFWLIKKSGETLNNVFTIKLNSDNQIIAGFTNKADENYDGLVYVQHASKNLYDENNIKIGSEVSFFLKPGDYSDLELKTINNYSFLAFQSDLTSDLLPNVPYVIDIRQNKGVTFVEDNEDNIDENTVIEVFDRDAFLQHIVDGEDYEETDKITGEKRKILQKTSSGTLLKYNISFQNAKDYTKRDLPTNHNFDGGNHFISDLATNIFNVNYGSITHLTLKNIRCEEELWFESAQSQNYDRWGVLCTLNEGVIDNVKIDDINLSVKLGRGYDDGTVAFQVGSLVGSNSGSISNIKYGNLNIKTNNSVNDNISAKLNLGGLIGQSVSLIQDVNPIDDSADINISSNLRGDLTSLFVGGAVGQSSGNIQSVSLRNINIDLSEAKGLIGNIGGITGRLRATAGNPSVLSNCTVKGTIKGLEVDSYSSMNAYSYTGGITGYNYNYNVLNCRSICDIIVSSDVSLEGAITYGTGGGFGRIVDGENLISGNYIIGSLLQGPSAITSSGAAYIGNFAGIIPLTVDWSDYSSKSNIVNNLIPGQYIGARIDDSVPSDD